MKDPDPKTLPLAEWGESPAKPAGPPGGSGVLSVRRELSPRQAVELSESQLAQLSLTLIAALKPQEAPAPDLPTFGELADEWCAKVEPLRVCRGQERRLIAHLRALFLDDESTLTASAIEAALQALAPELSASTINKIHGAGRKAIDEALRSRRWNSTNPFKLVRRKKEQPPKYQLLTLEELALVQAKLPAHRVGLFRCALHLGLRTGELLALKREDIDFARGVVLVRRSHGRDTTKTGRERVVPIVRAVAGDLQHAVDLEPGQLVFGRDDGGRQRADVKLTRMLRAAMVAAMVGIVAIHYKCRRCGRHEVAPPPVVLGRRCDCGMKFFPVPEAKAVRWYDLRHMCATFHHRAGADPLCVSLALGHSVQGTTHAIYTHPADDLMRRELSRWSLGG
jgi:integrase